MIESTNNRGLQGSRVLVTGGVGFLGRKVVEALLKAGSRVTVVDLPEALSSFHAPREGRLELVPCSLLDFEKLKTVVKDKDCIAHFAAISDVLRAFNDPRQAFTANCEGTQNLLEAVRLSKANPLFILSSSFVIYKSPPDYIPVDELHRIQPSTPYAYTKTCQDEMVEVYGRIYGLREVRLRLAPVFGPGQRMDSNIALFLRKAMKNDDITLEGGKQTRDWNYVDNVVQSVVSAMSGSTNGAFNIGGGTEFSLETVIEKVMKLTKSHSRLIRRDYRVGEGPSSRNILDIRKAEAQLGYHVSVNFDQGLKLLYAHMKHASP